MRHRGKGGKTRIGAPSTLEPGPDSYLLCYSIPVRASHIRPLGAEPKALRSPPRSPDEGIPCLFASRAKDGRCWPSLTRPQVRQQRRSGAILVALNRGSVSSGGVSWTSQQDTPQRADVDGSKEVSCRCPAVDDLVSYEPKSSGLNVGPKDLPLTLGSLAPPAAAPSRLSTCAPWANRPSPPRYLGGSVGLGRRHRG